MRLRTFRCSSSKSDIATIHSPQLHAASLQPRHPLVATVCHGRRSRHSCACAAVAADAGLSLPARRVAASMLGMAAGWGLLLSGSSTAQEALAGLVQQQGLAPTSAVYAQIADQQQQQRQGEAEPPLSCSLVSSDLSVAPELVSDAVTDADVEAASSQLCAGVNALEATLVNGLGWVVGEAQEVANFSESNFAAVGAPSSSMWLSHSPWCLMWDAYCNVLTTRPVATKLATGMVGTFLGDMVAQLMQNLLDTHAAVTAQGGRRRSMRGNSSSTAGGGAGQVELDFRRTARLVGFSALVGTPVAFVWFSLLDQYVLPTAPTSPLAVFSKVALDQVFMAPCMTTAFFAAMAVLEGGRSRNDVKSTLKSKLKPTLLANWTVWPLAHVINFALVPPAQRILYINVVNIAWTAFMSHMAASSSNTAAAAGAGVQQQTSSKHLQQVSR